MDSLPKKKKKTSTKPPSTDTTSSRAPGLQASSLIRSFRCRQNESTVARETQAAAGSASGVLGQPSSPGSRGKPGAQGRNCPTCFSAVMHFPRIAVAPSGEGSPSLGVSTGAAQAGEATLGAPEPLGTHWLAGCREDREEGLGV